MSLHRLSGMLERAELPTTQKCFKTPEGWGFGMGKTVPAAASVGWSPGAIFIHTNGASGDQIYVNQGTKASSGFVLSAAATLSGATTVSGGTQFDSTITVGLNDTGHDVKRFGCQSPR